MKITRIRVTPVKTPGSGPQPYVIHSINPIYYYRDLKYDAPPETRPKRPDGPDSLIVEIETDEGVTGVSQKGYGMPGVYPVLVDILVPLLIGEDPMRTDWLWEKMHRFSISQAREGIASSAISAIDTALWDLKGRYLNQPVYNLLGGKTKDRLRAYASRLYVYAGDRGDPDLGLLREEASMYVEQGFTAVKQRFGFSQDDGVEGMRKNRQVVQTLRETIGTDVEQMVDCCRSFTADYAIRMIRMVEEFDLAWVEEPVHPHDWPGYVKVRQAASMPISGGENEFGKHAFARWLEMGCADIWQPDVDRCAGITEVQKIVHLAAANDIPVITHGGWVANFHLALANMNMPLVEYFPDHNLDPDSQILTGQPRAENGYITLPDAPGLGLELNRDALKRFTWSG